MVKVFADGGFFKVEGEFDLGYIGNYKDEQIEIQEDSDEIRSWEFVSEALDTETCTDDEIADLLTEHINGVEKKIQKNIKQVNDNFLLKVFADMEACGSEFWKNEGLTVRGAMPDDPENAVYQPNHDALMKMVMEYRDTANDGSIVKTDVEAALRELYPMFDFDACIESIVPENICFFDTDISFQCSDGFDNAILCGAYDDLDAELRFTDWHNF